MPSSRHPPVNWGDACFFLPGGAVGRREPSWAKWNAGVIAMEHLSPETAIVLLAVSLVAGFIDAIAGGGALITIPALLAAGLPTASALATNKLQSAFGSFSASLNFIGKGHVSLGEMWLALAFAFVGASIGTILVQSLDPGFLRPPIPFCLSQVLPISPFHRG